MRNSKTNKKKELQNKHYHIQKTTKNIKSKEQNKTKKNPSHFSFPSIF